MGVLCPVVPVYCFTALVQSTGPVLSLVEGVGSVVSLVRCTGAVQEAGGVAADQDRHRRGLGCQSVVGGTQRIFCQATEEVILQPSCVVPLFLTSVQGHGRVCVSTPNADFFHFSVIQNQRRKKASFLEPQSLFQLNLYQHLMVMLP